MSGYVVPPGWPRQVRPPDAPEWERTAVGWLLDSGPPELRSYDVLRRHPVLLARFVLRHVDGGEAACRHGLSEARAELRGVVDADVIDEAVLAWHREQARLVALRREVGLVEEALRGRRFVARL